jgi:hypothetical protein
VDCGDTRRFRQGEHICSVYDAADEQLAVAAAYVAEGLRCGERCLYVVGTDEELQRCREALRGAGIDVARAEADGALHLRTSDKAHLAGGAFDSERMLGMLNDAVEDALDAGFAGLRTCGDMSWLLGDPPGATQVVEYESLLNPFFSNVRALGMCQYDRRKLPPGLLDHALATHSTVAVDGGSTPNPFYRPAPLSATRAAHPDDVDWKIRELRRRRSTTA